MAIKSKIVPFLWFDNNAGEAAEFYTSIFKNSRIVNTSYYGEGMPLPKGTVLTVAFELEGQPFTALNGGPLFKFTEAVSFVINCENQAEVDEFWNKLIADGGQPSQCGWLKDKFGLSWQVVPTVLSKLMSDPDQKKVGAVTQAFLKMQKFDIAALEKAYNEA